MLHFDDYGQKGIGWVIFFWIEISLRVKPPPPTMMIYAADTGE